MENLFSLTVPGAEGDPVKIIAPTGIPTGEQYSIGSLASFGISMALFIGIIFSLFYLIYGGAYWLQASSDKQKWDKARRIIIYSVLGFIVMSLSLVVVNTLARALGVKTLLGN